MGSSGVDFGRQLREQNAPPQKKFRSSAAPKGSKLAAGYQDRTQLRTATDEDDKAARVKALEEMVKLGQMEQGTFEKLRDEIVGGDVKNVHLVKGLDRKLLERVRRGEDVLKEPEQSENTDRDEPVEEKEEEEEVDVDEALDQMEEKEIVPLAKEKREKKGTMAPPPPPVAGRKRTRDDILRELKASRAKGAEPAPPPQPSLGSKFRKIGSKGQVGSRIEFDDKGREVLITVDEEGNVKRKIRKTKAPVNGTNGDEKSTALLLPDKDVAPLGMEAPVQKASESTQEDEVEDIFEGVGTDYDPLGGADDSESESESNSDPEPSFPSKPSHASPKEKVSASDSKPKPTSDDTATNVSTTMPSVPLSNLSRNYFNDEAASPSLSPEPVNPLKDPSILAALKKASSISTAATSTPEEAEEAAAKLARHKAMLEAHDRDAEDMDFGFGGSRFDNQEEGEDRKVKLARWDEKGDDDKREGKGEGKRKRGPKKRKGDGNSAKDVLAVLESRQKG